MSIEAAKVVVEPASSLHDEAVSLIVDGLEPGQDITLEASMTDSRGVPFFSYSHYKADDNGHVDVNTMESLGGSYKGLFPMGPIATLSPMLQKHKYTRFFKRDVDKPNLVTLSAFKGHLSHDELLDENRREPMSTTSHLRHYMAPGVQRIPVRYGSVRGCLFLPPGDGPFPGVIDLFGTAGGLLEYRSAQLASRGIASFAVAFFGYDDLPKTLEEFNISYFEEAVQFLLEHEKVINRGVGVIGTSKGGDLALAMAAFIPSVIACVTINCFHVPVMAGLRVGNHLHPGVINFFTINQCHLEDDGPIQLQGCSLKGQQIQDSIIPIERSNAAFLFLVGSDDRNINSEYFAQECCHRLREYNYCKAYEVISYPGTGHLLEPPYSPHCYASFHHIFMLPVVWGGDTKYHTLGQSKAWSKTINFLKHHIAHEGSLKDSEGRFTAHLKSKL